MNISGTLNVFRLIRDPTLCLPHHTVSTFNHLPVPLSKAFATRDREKGVDIRAVVLDKDNCFAVPHKNEVYTPYNVLNIFCPNRIRLLFKSCAIFQHSSCYTSLEAYFLLFNFLFYDSREARGRFR
jgi:Mitochondrial PGP phosphatase